jgi:hypothetical protein
MEVQATQTLPTVDTIVGAYIELRTRKDRINAEAKAAVKKLDDRMKKLEAWLQMKMHTDGVNALPTDAGTAYKANVEQATVSDMDAFLEYVRANDAYYLLEKRVSKLGVKALLEENQPLPPGINWYTSTAIHVRKPNER